MTNVRYGITNGMARKPDLLVEDTEKKIMFNWDKQSHEERWKDSEASAVIFQTTWKIIGVHNDNHPSHNLLFGRRGRAINKRFVFLCLKNCSKNENDRCMSRNIKIDVEWNYYHPNIWSTKTVYFVTRLLKIANNDYPSEIASNFQWFLYHIAEKIRVGITAKCTYMFLEYRIITI